MTNNTYPDPNYNQSLVPTSAKNTLGLVALIVAVAGFIFACVPGALIVGWVLLPIAFILSIVGLTRSGKKKGTSITALILSVVGTIVGFLVFAAVAVSAVDESFSENPIPTVDETVEVVDEPTSEEVVETEDLVVETEAPSEEPTESSLTLEQQNAVSSALDYLDYMAFSRDGLIGQLEYEGYSTEDATIAVDSVSVDWAEQAALKVDEYLSFMSFSRSGLVDQLEFEGFTADEAEYGVAAWDIDWNEQAAGKAQEYLDTMDFSRQGLIDQLVFEGFSQEQAEYGVAAVGL